MVPCVLDVGTGRCPAHQSRATGQVAIAIVQKRIRAIVQNPIAFTDDHRTHNPVARLVIDIRFACARRFRAGESRWMARRCLGRATGARSC